MRELTEIKIRSHVSGLFIIGTGYEQMVYAKATSVLPLIISYAYHRRGWETRAARRWNKIFES